MTSRRLRYSGSGAEMMSELVAGSAWMVAPPAEYDTACVLLSSREMRSCSPDNPPLFEPDMPAMPAVAWAAMPAAAFCVRAPPCAPAPPLAPPVAPGAEFACPVSNPPRTSAMRVACALRM